MHPPKPFAAGRSGPFFKPGAFKVGLSSLALAFAALIAGTITSVSQQPVAPPDTAQDLMRRAQSEGERRAVEDLITKLQGRAAVRPPAAPPATPAVAAPPAPIAAPVPPPMVPSTTTPPVITQTAPPPAPAAVPTQAAVPSPPVTERPTAAVASPTATEPVVAGPSAAPSLMPAKPPVVAGNVPAVAQRENLPTADLVVLFEFASAEISPLAALSLNTLGRTLADPRLSSQTFVIGGFTDGKGSPDYNLRLSLQRAETVRQYLISQFDIAPARLIAKGFGKSQLKNAANPQALENRRVQIINWTEKLGAKP